MRRLPLLTLAVAALAAPSLRAQAPVEAGALETRVWLDRGDEPVLRRGETVRVYYRASEDAYAAIFRIDTDGRISLVFPQDPSADYVVEGGRDYRLMLPRSPVWRVNDDPGAGYFFMIASPEPLDFSAFAFDPDFGWDLSAVGGVVYEDPYVAIDEYVATLLPSWETVPYALDFITYNVGDTYTYPRFLCYDCHDARPYASWNPYSVACTSYRVVIYDDPYFYPYYRYSGTHVVVVRPVVTQPRYAVAARAPGDSFRPLIRSRPAPPRVTAEFKESPGARAPTATPVRSRPRRSRSLPVRRFSAGRVSRRPGFPCGLRLRPRRERRPRRAGSSGRPYRPADAAVDLGHRGDAESPLAGADTTHARRYGLGHAEPSEHTARDPEPSEHAGSDTDPPERAAFGAQPSERAAVGTQSTPRAAVGAQSTQRAAVGAQPTQRPAGAPTQCPACTEPAERAAVPAQQPAEHAPGRALPAHGATPSEQLRSPAGRLRSARSRRVLRGL